MFISRYVFCCNPFSYYEDDVYLNGDKGRNGKRERVI